METKNFKVENLLVSVHSDRPSMGEAAAKDAAARINAVIAEKGEANVVFAAAPSQNETLEYLLKQNVDWSKVLAALAFLLLTSLPQEKYDPGLAEEFLPKKVRPKVPMRCRQYLPRPVEKASYRQNSPGLFLPW